MITKVSFEYSPFKDEDEYAKIQDTATRLQRFGPTYHSVTFGAGGSTKAGTAETVERLREAGFNAVPHISWGNSSRDEIFNLVDKYQQAHIKELIVLRGDLPSGYGSKANLPAAEKLVALLRTRYTTEQLYLRVGCYPEVHPDASSMSEDLASLKRKVDAGAGRVRHPVFLQRRCIRRFRESLFASRYDCTINTGNLADHQFSNHRSIFCEVRRRGSTLVSASTRGVKRRRSFTQSVWRRVCVQSM